ncbi:hypothetical protein PTE30175_00862 [Pandoraea terrae]|uniref:Transmembrane protein n=1 Tax=Pandoraea terrae TaxID=1537710 RepID=A0A5E4SPZ6_9BURK|nr:hypothetical protein [Pandoraea terrae]VVD76983.1 hypothetical protein PTE30175_00862 [Pandoraea terrae]
MSTGQDLLLTLRFELRRLFGVPGLLGSVLLAAGLAMWFAIPVVESSTRVLLERTRLAHLERLHASERVLVSTNAWSPDKLPGLFPVFTQSGNDIDVIFEQARQSNLTLGSAQYQIVADRSGQFTHYQVLLPVKDRYGVIRRFVALVLNNVPNAALQEIHVERPAVDGDVLEASIRFDLIYRTSGP